MKISMKKIAFYSVIAAVAIGCKKNDHDHDHDHGDSKEEYAFVRLLVADAESATISEIAPVNGKINTFNATYPNATLHTTGNKRFAALLYGQQNFTEFFDIGLESHGDHVDIKGTPKFAAITGNGARPAHFKSRGSESLIFNDGDGTLSVGEEADFHTPGGKLKTITTGLAAHHGAMAQFSNGTYAITQPDASSALGGPHGVRIIDKNGGVVHESKIAVSRIHGNATDGLNAVFGVAGGALVVKQDGTQRIINNPEGFGDIRLGTILEAAGVNKFVGFVATKGAYFIDIVGNKIVPIFESTAIVQCKVDAAGKNLYTLLSDGTLKIFDLNNGSLKKEGKVIAAINSADAFKPVLEATNKFIYLISPNEGLLYQISTADFNAVKKHTVTAKPSRLALLGFETSESH